MSNLARVPLAAVVCPSAPFLAPRLLRATISSTTTISTTSTSTSTTSVGHSQQRNLSSSSRCNVNANANSNAAKGKKSGRSYFLEMRKREKQQANRRAKAKAASADVSPEVIELALAMQKALQARNLDDIIDLYPAASEAGLIDSNATYMVSQTLHEAIRRDVAKKDSSRLSKLLHFVGQLVADLQSKRISPNTFAYVHLLGAYKDSKHFTNGRLLWDWLTAQDDAHCSQAAYGAAIELMSYGNLMSLPELELLYEEGLKRFPGTYAEYHLSPDAIVPDRTQPVHIVGLPTVLFQGIITARLRAHDWKRAYLGLDTILRLYPGQTPHRVFELFMTERPLFEAYTAYLLACRSGVQISGGQVTILLNKLRVAMTQHSSLQRRFELVRAMANALYAFQQCGGPLKGVHVGQLIKAFEFMLPEKAPGQDFTPEEAGLRNTIAATAQNIVAELIQAGLSVSYHPFVSLISLAGKLRAPELFKQTLEDAKTAGITFYSVERRTLLTAAGLIKDRDLVKALWSLTVASANTEGTPLGYNDWITFAKACRRSEYTQYFEQQLQEQAHSITSAVEKRVRSEASNSEPGAAQPTLQLMTPEQLDSEIQTLQGQMENIRAVLMSGQPLDFEKSPFYMHIDPKQSSLGTPQDLRTIYDEFTTDPNQPAAAPGTNPQAIAPALSTTGIPLDQLRFRNWVNVHEMMSFASGYAESKKSTISKAIAQRKSPKHIFESLFVPTITPAQNTDDLRARIKTLRSPDPAYTTGQIFRRIGSETAPGTPDFHNTFKQPKIKINKHVTKDFTLRTFDTETPAEVFEPKTKDPSTSRWVSRQFIKVKSEDRYKEAKGRFEVFAGDEAEKSGKEGSS